MSAAIYRFEISKSNRAGCQNSACKHAKVKIQKGELRLGTLVTIKDHTSWAWKHWGCVTPHQIEVIIGQLGGLEGYDLENDLDVLDGWDELPDWAQDKIRESIRRGHVSDEDWKGEPELNRPGMKGINKRTPKKKAVEEDEENGEDVETTPTKAKKGKKRKEAPADDEDEPAPKKKSRTKKPKVASEDEEDAEDEPQPPKRKSAAKRKKRAMKEEESDDDDETAKGKAAAKRQKRAIKKEESDAEDDEPAYDPPKKKPRGRNIKAEPVKDEETDDADEPAYDPPKKKGRGRKVKAEPAEDDTVMAQLDGPADDDEDSPLWTLLEKPKRRKTWAQFEREITEYRALSPLSRDAHPFQEIKASGMGALCVETLMELQDEQFKKHRKTKKSTKSATAVNGHEVDGDAQNSPVETRSTRPTKVTASTDEAKGKDDTKTKRGRSSKVK